MSADLKHDGRNWMVLKITYESVTSDFFSKFRDHSSKHLLLSSSLLKYVFDGFLLEFSGTEHIQKKCSSGIKQY